MIKWLIKFVSGGMLNRVLDTLDRKRDSEVERERIGAGLAAKQIEAEIEARKNAREIRLATAGFWEMRLLTFIIALCFVSHLVLVTLATNFRLFHDWCYEVGSRTVCGVPAFPSPFDEWEGAILLSFFGIYTVGKGISTVAASIARRR